MSGTNSYLSAANDCTPVQEVESFVVLTAGQTVFTLSHIPSGDVFMQVNGSGRLTSITSFGTAATYNPALNGGYVLQVGDELEIGYMRLDCTTVPANTPVPLDYATGPEYPQTGDAQLTTPDYVAAAIDAIPNDPITPLAGVAALTDASRGLSLGEVDIPTNRALTVAEMTQANADKVGVPLSDQIAVFTNRAIDTERAVGATGVMNTNGQLGHQTRLFFATAANFATVVQTALDNNGAHLSVDFTGGETIVMPAARCAGQMLTLRFDAASTSKELIIDKTGITWAGMIRDSQHRIRPSAPADNFLIVRPGEEIQLYGLGAGTPGWMVAPFEMSMLSGTTWLERHDGKVDINAAVSFATSTPAGRTLAITYTLPITIADYAGTTFHMTDVAGGAIALGLSASIAGIASAIYGEHQPNRTPTSLRLLARNTLAVAATPGVVTLSILAAKPDYLALGGVASF